MKINFESELMENQKHAVVMAPDAAFEVLQSQDGDALFFSLGTDNIFYLTREAAASSTGWNQVKLSSTAASQLSPTATAKTFSVAQNAQTMAIDIVLVLTSDGVDYLFVSLGNANTDAAWANGVTWTAVPFDAGTAPTPLTISDVYAMNIPGVGGGATENIFVDILRTGGGDGLSLLNRYYITPGASPQWNAHSLPSDLAAGSVSSCLANRAGDPLPGIYTFGAIVNEQELFFTAQYNYFQSDEPPTPAYFVVPPGASAVASAINTAGVSNLFIAGSAGLYVFTPENQNGSAIPVLVAASPLTAGATRLAAATTATRTAVWGVDPQGTLFYAACAAGSEGVSSAWSNPAPLLTSVEGFAFYLNLNAGNNTLFADMDGQNLVQLTQDPVTSFWSQRSILLPSTEPNDMAVYQSYTTHIQITDDNGMPAPSTAACLTATSAVSVYVNDLYYRLSPTVPINVSADATGVLTIVQETHSIAGVCMQLTIVAAPSVAAQINPLSKAMTTLGSITDGPSLTNVQVTNADGTTKPLVPSGTAPADATSAASSIANFVQISSTLPADGSNQKSAGSGPAPMAVISPAAPTTSPKKCWGMSFGGGKMTYHEGMDAAEVLGLRRPASGAAMVAPEIPSPPGLPEVSMLAGDIFLWLKTAFDSVESFVVQEVDGIYHFLANIAGKIYDALLDCVQAIAHAVEWVFDQIAVAFEDLIKWIGFLFEWPDIVNTHNVLKNVFKQCAQRAIDSLSTTLAGDIQTALNGIEDKVNTWAGISSPADTMGSYQSSSPSNGSSSPQSNWASHHLKSNAAAATTTYSEPSGSDSIDAILNDLQGMISADVLNTLWQQLKTDIFDQIGSLSASQIVAKLAVIVVDAILTTAGTVIVKALDIFALVVDGILDLLDAPISIPILSPMYKLIAKSELSFLDLACLVGAIPATLIYKIAAGSAPFSDADATALTNAPDFDSLQALLTGAGPQSKRAVAGGVMPDVTAATASTENLLATLGCLAGFAALMGSAMVVMIGTIKAATPGDVPIPASLRYLAASFYLPYVAPDLVGAFTASTSWPTAMNDVVTSVAVLKTFADNNGTLAEKMLWANWASPATESFLNAVWLFPAIGAIIASEKKASDWLGLAGNLAFDIGGIFTVGAAPRFNSNVASAEEFQVAIDLLTMSYGFLATAQGVALSNGS